MMVRALGRPFVLRAISRRLRGLMRGVEDFSSEEGNLAFGYETTNRRCRALVPSMAFVFLFCAESHLDLWR